MSDLPQPFLSESPKEECGIFGIYSPGHQAARLTFFGLFALQHRGQESAGIAVSDGKQVQMHREMGLVSQVFNEAKLEELPGELAIGHNRYSTTGASLLRNAQPIFCQSTIGEISVAHNGNLTNANKLRATLAAEGEILETTSDTEVIARLLIRNLHLGPEHAVAATMRLLEGAYSCAVLTPDLLIGFRDPNGIRPLSCGKFHDGYMFASETCAFGPIGGEVDRELAPGEMVIIDRQGVRFAQGAPPQKESMCLFEYIYFARPDSIMNGHLLYGVRERMGAQLWNEHPVEADVVVPVPDSGIPAALGFAEASGIPFREGMTKSRYIHRTFIQPDQSMRELGVRMKLTPLTEHVRDKRIVLVDDSIVRATTTGKIVRMMKEAGALEVHVRITAPPIKFPCFYGIDMASKQELAAAKWTIEEIREHIGADSLGYLSIEGAAAATGNAEQKLCLACFNGSYPIKISKELTKDAYEHAPSIGEMVATKKQ